MNIAFITGATGQDGSYLIEFLFNKNHNVVRMM
jgi:GDP-D-mannose dehydratase